MTPAPTARRPSSSIRSVPATPPAHVVSFDNGDGTSFTIWLAQGNWYWFTINDNTTGVEEFQAWGFVPPGSLGSDPFATVFAGYHGNYQAGQGFALLDKSACPPARQTTHGLQSVCSG